jgi:hypothetical protein
MSTLTEITEPINFLSSKKTVDWRYKNYNKLKQKNNLLVRNCQT